MQNPTARLQAGGSAVQKRRRATAAKAKASTAAAEKPAAAPRLLSKSPHRLGSSAGNEHPVCSSYSS